MEGLTKQQIVLVALLISFVTSIATGIVTVALMDQAPPGVTQTINRVVERTIEKVTPSPTPSQTASVVTRETIVVKEDELVVEAIEKNTKSLVSIIRVLGEGEFSTQSFTGNGLLIGKDGLIATDASSVAPILDENSNVLVQSFKAVLHDGVIVNLNRVSVSDSQGIVLFRPVLDEKVKKMVFYPASLNDSAMLKLGQAVIAMGGERLSVATGIVSNISNSNVVVESASTSTDTHNITKPLIIKTDVSAPGKALGSVLINLSGDVVGIRSVLAGGSDSAFISSGIIGLAVKSSVKAN